MKNKYLAIIPARAGSKRLPRKNILDLNGKPLIQYSIEAALNCKEIDEIIVTSDSQEILNLSKSLKVTAIKRPKELAKDTSPTFEAIEHAVSSLDKKYENLILLQPTSPLRTSEDLQKAIKEYEEKKANSLVSVCECEHSPLWSNTLPSNKSMENFLSSKLLNKRSQDLEKFYRLNGAIYIGNTKKVLKEKTFYLKENIYAYEMDQINSIDIDTKLDFLFAQSILKEKLF